MSELSTISRVRRSASLLACLTIVSLVTSCSLRPTKVRSAYQEAYDPSSGHWADLGDDLFGKKMVQTGLFKPQRFLDVVGFGIFLTAPHDPDRIPVLLLHGHAGGPRLMEHLAASLDPDVYEPWYGYYPTGLHVDHLARLLHEKLARMASKHDVSTVHIVAHSMGGLVARAALKPSAGDQPLPAIPHLVCIATPWSGDPRPARWTWSPAAPPSWEDMSPDSDFVAHLFDDPLPKGTSLHVIYGLDGATEDAPRKTDGVVTVESLTRPQALEEASTVDVFPGSSHVSLLTDPDPARLVTEILSSSTP